MPPKITVNATTYESVEAMPPDVRAFYERAMQAAGTGKPVIQNHELKLSFQLTGPNFRFRVGPAPPAPTGEPAAIAMPASPPLPTASIDFDARPQPIEPSSGGGASRVALVLAATTAAAIGLWFWMRAH